ELVLRVLQAEQAAASEQDHLLAQRKHGGNWLPVHPLSALLQQTIVGDRENLVHHQEQPGDVELPGDLQRHGRSLEVLPVRAEQEDERIGDRDGEQCLFVQTGVGIDEEVVQVQILDQVAEAIGQQIDVVALSQDAGDVARA